MKFTKHIWAGILTGVSLGINQGIKSHGNVIELDPYMVVTTGTRTERLAIKSPIRTDVMDNGLIGLTGAPDLASALEYLPGIRVEANCQNCGTAEVKLLGLGAGYNQLLFNGHPLFGGLAAVYGLEHIPTAFIERIEVVKGGASSLYGAGAVAGVINIIPAEPMENKVRLETSLEDFKGNPSKSAVAVWDWVESGHAVAATFFSELRQNEAVDLNDDGFSEITEKDFQTLGSNFNWYPGFETRITGNYAYTEETRRGGDRFDLLPHESQITEELHHRWHRAGLNLAHKVTADLDLRMGASVSKIERDSYYGGVGAVPLPGEPGHVPADYTDALETSRMLYGYTETTRVFGEILATQHFRNHVITVGSQYLRDQVFDEKRDESGNALRSNGSIALFSGEDPIADHQFSTVGFMVQDEWEPHEKLSIIAGLRLDRHSELSKWINSPRIAMRYEWNPEFSLHASAASGFRAPEVFDEDFHIEILDDPTRTRNAPSLEEEKSKSISAGITWRPFLSGRPLQIVVDLFRTRLSDTFHVPDIVFTDASGNAFKQRINSGGSLIRGIELNLFYPISGQLSIEAGITIMDAKFDNPVEVLEGTFESKFVESPDWSGVVKINYKPNDKLDIFAGIIFTGPMIALRELEGSINRDTGNFFVIDLILIRHFDVDNPVDAHLDVSIGVRNLLDQRQDDLTSGPDRDTTYFYGPRFPRSLFIKAALEF